jgi:DNA-binding CsgD family transcriptional regulator
MAALLGTDFPAGDLGAATGLPAVTVVAGVREALAAGVLTGSVERAAFRQPLVRLALREATPAGLRTALHRHLAGVLASSGAPADRVAAQLVAAPDAVDGWTTAWLVDHRTDLVRTAPRAAATLLQRVLDNLRADDARREPTEVSLAVVLRRLARFEDLERVARHALARAGSAPHLARMTWLQAFALMHIQPEKGLDITASPIIGDGLDNRWTARLGALRALILCVVGRFAEVPAAAGQALSLGRRIDDRVAIGYALYAMALRESRVDIGRAVRFAERALAAAAGDPETTELRLMLLRDQTRAFDRLGMQAEAEAAVRATLDLATQLSPSGLVQVHLQTAEHRFDVGDWDAALALLEAIEDAPETGYVPVRLHGLSALIAGHRDEQAIARTHLDRLRHRISATTLGEYGEYLVRVRALVAERNGRPEQALQILAQQLGPRLRVGFYELPGLVRLALGADDRTLANTAVEAAVADAAQSAGGHKRAAVANHCRGLVESDPGPLREAAAYFRDTGQPLELASALEDVAMVHGERSETADGRAAFAECAETYLRLGAAWDLRRAEFRLRPYGIGRGRRGPRGRPPAGWQALTPAELKVAELVSEGRSNPEIATELYLSRRTVQTHVSHILAKLGIRSRDEVAEVRARSGAL